MLKQIVNKFVEKKRKYSIMFKDILAFLTLNYRDASLITAYFIFLGIIPKIRLIG